MVFVHSRKDTVKSAQALVDIAREKNELVLFDSNTADGENALSSKPVGKGRKEPEETTRGKVKRTCTVSTQDLMWAKRELGKSRNRELKQLVPYGFGTHHAGILPNYYYLLTLHVLICLQVDGLLNVFVSGMLRSDRNLVERLFSLGIVRVLVCTATLAWGVNLPAHCVIIKGTRVYKADR
tara:strand:+ start:990 stop:1532 length:543 start_codon:yes stop_codon:yes gene_type:complete